MATMTTSAMTYYDRQRCKPCDAQLSWTMAMFVMLLLAMMAQQASGICTTIDQVQQDSLNASLTSVTITCLPNYQLRITNVTVDQQPTAPSSIINITCLQADQTSFVLAQCPRPTNPDCTFRPTLNSSSTSCSGLYLVTTTYRCLPVYRRSTDPQPSTGSSIVVGSNALVQNSGISIGSLTSPDTIRYFSIYVPADLEVILSVDFVFFLGATPPSCSSRVVFFDINNQTVAQFCNGSSPNVILGCGSGSPKFFRVQYVTDSPAIDFKYSIALTVHQTGKITAQGGTPPFPLFAVDSFTTTSIPSSSTAAPRTTAGPITTTPSTSQRTTARSVTTTAIVPTTRAAISTSVSTQSTTTSQATSKTASAETTTGSVVSTTGVNTVGPVSTTRSMVTTAAGPVATTARPIVTTAALPPVPTSGPMLTTAAGPVVTTARPTMKTTAGPVVPTSAAAVVTTSAPKVQTTARQVTTAAPRVTSTAFPVQTTGVSAVAVTPAADTSSSSATSSTPSATSSPTATPTGQGVAGFGTLNQSAVAGIVVGSFIAGTILIISTIIGAYYGCTPSAPLTNSAVQTPASQATVQMPAKPPPTTINYQLDPRSNNTGPFRNVAEFYVDGNKSSTLVLNRKQEPQVYKTVISV